MAGVESITNAIIEEARENSEKIIADARSKADSIIKDAETASAEIIHEAEEKARKASADHKERVSSQKDRKRREAILTGKQEAISHVIDLTFERLKDLDDDAYFAMIEKLAGKNIQPGKGEILFSEKDLKRLPEGFTEKLQEMASDAGGELSLSSDTAPIESGFILRYGGIDLNLSLSAIFHEKRAKLRDTARAALFD